MTTLFKSKNFWGIAGAILLILIFCGIIVFIFCFFSFSETVKLTSKQLYIMYSQNESATDEKLSGNIIELTGFVTSVDDDSDASSPGITLGDDSDDVVLFDSKLMINSDQKNLVALLQRGDEVTASCNKVQRIMNTPFLDNCTILNIFTPISEDTTHQILLNKIYSDYNGTHFDFNLKIFSKPDLQNYATFVVSADCASNKVVFKNVVFLEKNKQGREKIINATEIKNPDVKQNKIIRDAVRLNKVFLNDIEADADKRIILNNYIQNVCALPVSLSSN